MEFNPLAKKLRLDKASRAALVNSPEGYVQELQPLPAELNMAHSLQGDHDWIQLFCRTQAEFEEWLPKVVAGMATQSLLWISFPKGTSGMQTDLTRDKGWEALGNVDLRFITLVAVNDTWSAFSMRTYKPGEERRPNPFLRS